MMGIFLFFMNKCLAKQTRSQKKRVSLVLDMVVSGEVFGNHGKEARKKFVKKQVQKTFSAWDLCKAKDTCHQGCLNLQGIEAVRNVENLEKYKRGLIPSKSTVWRKGNELLKEVGYPTFDVMHRDDCSFGKAVKLG